LKTLTASGAGSAGIDADNVGTRTACRFDGVPEKNTAMQQSPKRNYRLNKEQVTLVLTSAAPTPASSGVGNKQVKKKVKAITAPLIHSQTTATTVTASQPGIVVTTVGAIEPGQVQPLPMLDLL